MTWQAAPVLVEREKCTGVPCGICKMTIYRVREFRFFKKKAAISLTARLATIDANTFGNPTWRPLDRFANATR